MNDNVKEEEVEVTEKLLMNSLDPGYLKFPGKVKDIFSERYGLKVVELPTPRAFIREDEDMFRLIYEFDKEKLRKMEVSR